MGLDNAEVMVLCMPAHEAQLMHLTCKGNIPWLVMAWDLELAPAYDMHKLLLISIHALQCSGRIQLMHLTCKINKTATYSGW